MASPELSAKEVLMPVDPNAPVRISAFNWVPAFAQGQVRDLRPRWALEEAGIPYAVRKLDAMAERPADNYEEQPFGQVPSYHDDTVSLFESGAIVLHIGRDCEMLLPADPNARARATAWLIVCILPSTELLSVCAHLVMAGLKVSRRYDAKKRSAILSASPSVARAA